MALASVAVPTVERALAPIRSWSTMIAVVRPSSTSTARGDEPFMQPGQGLGNEAGNPHQDLDGVAFPIAGLVLLGRPCRHSTDLIVIQPPMERVQVPLRPARGSGPGGSAPRPVSHRTAPRLADHVPGDVPVVPV
jgi:hypothetical protein